MNILNDKILPHETTMEIAYRIKPTAILNFCYVNNYMGNICYSKTFWRNYINGNQNRWYNLMISAAKQGDMRMFKFLWSITLDIGIIIENKVLYPAFTETVKNGYNKFSNWIYLKYSQWRLTRSYNAEREFTDKKREKEKNYILMIEAAKAGDINKFSILNKNNKSDYNANRAINYSLNLQVYKKLYPITYHYIKNRPLNNENLINMFPNVLIYGNVNLADEFISEIKLDKIDKESFEYLLSSDYPFALEYIKDKGVNINNMLATFISPIRNWSIMKNYLHYEVPYENFKSVLLNSYEAFSFHQEEYINIINKELKCLSAREYQNMLYYLIEAGEDYIAYLLINNVEICE